MIKNPIAVINDFSGGQDTKTPIISMGLNKSPNMRNFHCAGIKERLMKRGGYAKVNSIVVPSDNLDVYYPAGYQTYDYPLRTTAAYTQISQGFKCATSSTVTKIKLWLKKTGTPAGTDTITLEIMTDSSGIPSGTVISNGTSTAVDISDTLTTSYAWVTFTFASAPTLVAGTQYHLSLKGAYTVSGTNYVIWGADNYDVLYQDGSMSRFDSALWTADTKYNACFEVYITGGAKGNDGVAVYDFSSKSMLLGIFGTSLYKMDKNSAGTPDGSWDGVNIGSSSGGEVDLMEYSSDANARAAYVTNAGTYDAYTKLLIHFDGANAATTYTAETGQTVTFVNQAQLAIAQSVFGVSSLAFDATGDYVTVPDSADWDFGSGAFSVEFRVRWSTINSSSTVAVGQTVDGSNQWTFFYNGAGILRFYNYSGASYTVFFEASWTPTVNTWYKIELTRVNTDNAATGWRVFVDGVSLTLTLQGGAWNGSMTNYAAPLKIFLENGGWIDELRVSKGIARNSSNYTIETGEFPADLQCNSEATLKTQGSYSLKCVAVATASLNKTLTRTIAVPVDLTGKTTIYFDIYASRTGANIKIGIYDATVPTTTEKTYTVLAANTWETVTWDISAVTDANKDGITKIIITVVNADVDNIFYIDNMYAIVTGSEYSLTSSRFLTFADWQAGRALINTDIGMYSYTGTGNTAVVAAAPISKYIAIFRNYVFAAGIRGLPNTIRYSDLSDYTTWTAGNTLSANTNDGDVITGMRILKGKLYIFKRYSIHRISYLGSNPTFQVDQILGIGCPAHYTIKEVELGGDVGTVLIFLTTDKKLAIFDGYNIQIINDSLIEESNDLFGASDDQPLSFSDMNLVYADLFHAVVKTDTSEYILYCVLGDDTSINYAFVFDYKTGGVYPYDGQAFASSCYALSTNKAKILYCAGYTGYMWQMESGNSDDSSAINGYWVSAKIKPSLASLMAKALQLGLNLKEVYSVSTLSAYFQMRIDFNVSWTDAEAFTYNRADVLTFGKTTLIDIGTIENMLQIKIKDNSTNLALTLYGVDLYGAPLGLSVGDRAVA